MARTLAVSKVEDHAEFVMGREIAPVEGVYTTLGDLHVLLGHHPPGQSHGFTARVGHRDRATYSTAGISWPSRDSAAPSTLPNASSSSPRLSAIQQCEANRPLPMASFEDIRSSHGERLWRSSKSLLRHRPLGHLAQEQGPFVEPSSSTLARIQTIRYFTWGRLFEPVIEVRPG